MQELSTEEILRNIKQRAITLQKLFLLCIYEKQQSLNYHGEWSKFHQPQLAQWPAETGMNVAFKKFSKHAYNQYSELTKFHQPIQLATISPKGHKEIFYIYDTKKLSQVNFHAHVNRLVILFSQFSIQFENELKLE